MHKTIKEIIEEKPLGKKVVVKGWVRTNRSQQEFSFLTIHDGSMFNGIQSIISKDINNYKEVKKLTSGCSVSVEGVLVESPAKGQEFELKAEKVEVLGWVENPNNYPMSMKRHTLEHLREYAHLRSRMNLAGSVTRVRNCIAKGIHDFFYEQNFNWVATPILTASDCEGAGEMFKVSTLDFKNIPKKENGDIDFSKDFFGKQTSLTVSGQLNAEAYACALTKVYTFGPTFRAENSNTSRHLAEFWMVEPEMAFYDMHDTIELSSNLLNYVIKKVLNERQDDMVFFDNFVNKGIVERLKEFVSKEFVILDYTKTIDVLLKSNKKFEVEPYWGIDLGAEHERYLAEDYVKSPVALVNYPKEIKSFYMRQNDDNKTVAAFDILAPYIGEIIGGSQREERYNNLVSRMLELNMDIDEYQWYLDLRRYGTVIHSGFGLGLERLVSYVTGVANVRDTIPFPRTPKNVDF